MRKREHLRAIKLCTEYIERRGAKQVKTVMPGCYSVSYRHKDYTLNFERYEQGSRVFSIFGRFDAARENLGNKYSGKYNLHALNNCPVEIFTEFKNFIERV